MRIFNYLIKTWFCNDHLTNQTFIFSKYLIKLIAILLFAWLYINNSIRFSSIAFYLYMRDWEIILLIENICVLQRIICLQINYFSRFYII